MRMDSTVALVGSMSSLNGQDFLFGKFSPESFCRLEDIQLIN
jgi:hypothetical protein